MKCNEELESYLAFFFSFFNMMKLGKLAILGSKYTNWKVVAI